MKLNKYYINKRYRNKYAKDDDDYDYTPITPKEGTQIIEEANISNDLRDLIIEAREKTEETSNIMEKDKQYMTKNYMGLMGLYMEYNNVDKQIKITENEGEILKNKIGTDQEGKFAEFKYKNIQNSLNELKSAAKTNYEKLYNTMVAQTVLLKSVAKTRVLYNRESKYSIFTITKTADEIKKAIEDVMDEYGVVYDPFTGENSITLPDQSIYEKFATDMKDMLVDIDKQIPSYIDEMTKKIKDLEKQKKEVEKYIEEKEKKGIKSYKEIIDDLEKSLAMYKEEGKLTPSDIKSISEQMERIQNSLYGEFEDDNTEYVLLYTKYMNNIKEVNKLKKFFVTKMKERESILKEDTKNSEIKQIKTYYYEAIDTIKYINEELTKKIGEIENIEKQTKAERDELEKLKKEKEDIDNFKKQLELKETQIKKLNEEQVLLSDRLLKKGKDVSDAEKKVQELQKAKDALDLAKKERDDLIKIIDANYIKDDQKAKIIYDVLEKNILNLESIIYAAFAHYRDAFSINGYDTHPFKEYMGFLLNEKNNYGFLKNKTEKTDRYYYMAFSQYKDIFDKSKISLVEEQEKEKYMKDPLFSIGLVKEDKTVERGLGMWFYTLSLDKDNILIKTTQITGGNNEYDKFSYKGLFMKIYNNIGTDTIKKKALENISKYVYDNMGNSEGPEYTLYKGSYAEYLKKNIDNKEVKGEGFYGGKKKKKLTKQDIKRIANKIYNKKRGGDLIKAFQNIGNQEMPRSCREFLEQYGDREILSIQIGRRPVQGFIAPILDLLSSGEFSRRKNDLNIDSMFHVWTNPIIDDNGRMRTVTVEKNQTLNIGWNQYDQTEDYYTVSPATYPLTLNEYVENGLNYLRSKGLNPFNYDGAYNNCQKFVEALMVSNNLDYPDIRQFILQNTEYIVGQLDKHTQSIMKGAIDSAQFWNILVNGAGLRKRRPKIYD